MKEINVNNKDYKDTLLLPNTDFSMRANLAQSEIKILEFWQKIELFSKLRNDSQGKKTFILHDGPPYANGHLHMGHAFNKILKDIINKSKQMMGYDANYRPGWDCHGLPIEWRVEELFVGEGRQKHTIPGSEFRKRCREFAQQWIDIQKQEFKRYGIIGDWDNPYTTMAYEAESTIVSELLKFVTAGCVYRGAKPVMWAPVEQTALAEAEIEYHDKVSTQIWVKFPLKSKEHQEKYENVSVVIWTTTPWTIPCNRAITFGEDIIYSIYQVTDSPDDNWAKMGDKYLIADKCADMVKNSLRIDQFTKLKTIDSQELARFICHHPLVKRGFDHDIPLFAADHVTDENGTGFVHCAPSHGLEDFMAFKKNGLDISNLPYFVDEKGCFTKHALEFSGHNIFITSGKKTGKDGSANQAVINALVEEGNILARNNFTHSYPHSWRSKAPIIYRLTPQWFLSMGSGEQSLKQKSIDCLEKVKFYPERSRQRITKMISGRPDWLISRQRAWGTPITIFADKDTGTPLNDMIIHKKVISKIKEHGIESWFETDKSEFLLPEYDPDKYEKITDILDVWFDSGCTHSFVLDGKNGLGFPADLYLEGSDQHRGWFQSSLINSCGIKGTSPFKAVLTHGFVLDKKGYKMSKSVGNIISPEKIIKQYGCDILRLWAANMDYTDDIRIGEEVIKTSVDQYRKIRNTLRYMLGAIAACNPNDQQQLTAIPDLEKYILHLLYNLNSQVISAYEEFNFRKAFRMIFDFMSQDLSAFYFDMRKDNLYCDAKTDHDRMASIEVIKILFDSILRLLSPILSFTCEEAYKTYYKEKSLTNSVHELEFLKLPENFLNNEIFEKYSFIRKHRSSILSALELARKQKIIGSSLEAHVKFYGSKELISKLQNIAWREIAMIANIDFYNEEIKEPLYKEDNLAIMIEKSDFDKCARCWRFIDLPPQSDICQRCYSVVNKVVNKNEN